MPLTPSATDLLIQRLRRAARVFQTAVQKHLDTDDTARFSQEALEDLADLSTVAANKLSWLDTEVRRLSADISKDSQKLRMILWDIYKQGFEAGMQAAQQIHPMLNEAVSKLQSEATNEESS